MRAAIRRQLQLLPRQLARRWLILGAAVAVVVSTDFVVARRRVHAEAQRAAAAWAERIALGMTRAFAERRSEIGVLARSPQAAALAAAYGSGDTVRWSRAVETILPRWRLRQPVSAAAYHRLRLVTENGSTIARLVDESAPRDTGDAAPAAWTDSAFVPSASTTHATIRADVSPSALLSVPLRDSLRVAGVSFGVYTARRAPLFVFPVSAPSSREAVTANTDAGPDWTVRVAVPARIVASPWQAMWITHLLIAATAVLGIFGVGVAVARRAMRTAVQPDPRVSWILGWLTESRGASATPDQIAAELGHELRNPLSSIRLNLQALARDVAAQRVSPTATRSVELSLQQIDRIDTLARSALGLARVAGERVVACDAMSLVERAIDATAAERASRMQRIDVTHAGADGLTIRGKRGALEGALVNLLLNASQHAPDGSTIHVAVEGGDGGVRIIVRDEGGGVPEHLEARIFEPFFTSRPTGGGLGLAIARRTLREHGGDIRLERGAGLGATFVMDLTHTEARR